MSIIRRFYCEVCEEWIEHDAPQNSVQEGIIAGMDHFRVMHPDIFDEIETWPDGAPVVLDKSLEPTDFNSEEIEHRRKNFYFNGE